MKPETLRELSLSLAEELHHEARLERLMEINSKYLMAAWTDGFADGYVQGRIPLIELVEAEPLTLEVETPENA